VEREGPVPVASERVKTTDAATQGPSEFCTTERVYVRAIGVTDKLYKFSVLQGHNFLKARHQGLKVGFDLDLERRTFLPTNPHLLVKLSLLFL
jgi:hypothetical protein